MGIEEAVVSDEHMVEVDSEAGAMWDTAFSIDEDVDEEAGTMWDKAFSTDDDEIDVKKASIRLCFFTGGAGIYKVR